VEKRVHGGAGATPSTGPACGTRESQSPREPPDCSAGELTMPPQWSANDAFDRRRWSAMKAVTLRDGCCGRVQVPWLNAQSHVRARAALVDAMEKHCIDEHVRCGRAQLGLIY